MRHPKLIQWEKTLKSVLDEIDDILESRYGSDYSLHPARRQRGSTANKSHDGLFDIRGEFTLGLGSEKGKGYIVDIDLKTLQSVPKSVITRIEDDTIHELNKRLPKAFPNRDLRVEHDGNMIKIIGDLSLGKL
ncbi:MAG: hypothetical protein KAT14_03705 [Candidatus Marinimicrobia bacterium]|nr:hypothetical protein [Candidatus Neomarinimicrobiota bacterium]